MPVGDFTVTYTDGSTEDVQSNFRGLVEIERRWPGQENVPAVEAIGIAVWHYLGCPGESLDDWLGRVHLIEDAEELARRTKVTELPEPEVPTEPAVGAA